MQEIVRWVFCGFGVLMFIAGFFMIRFRVRLAEQQQAQSEKTALAKSGPFGPGRATPRQQVIIGIFFIAFGPTIVLLGFLVNWSHFVGR